MRNEYAIDWIAWVLVIIGAINWGLVGFFNYDLVIGIFGDSFAIVGIAGLYLIIRAFMVPMSKTRM